MAQVDPLPAEDPGYQTSRARAASFIVAAGMFTFLLFIVATRDVFLFDLRRVTPILGVLVLSNLVLGLTAARWASWRRAIFVYQVLQIAAFTLILHRLGGLVMEILVITYAFPVIIAEMLGSPGTVFAIANVSAGCFATMIWVENETLAELGLDTHQQRAFVVFVFLVLNFLALHTNRYGYQLRNLARHLQEKVAERTAALSAANERLAAQARALEEKQDELRNFVYTVTHDLKSPLSAILLTADLLLQRERGALDVDGREDLERIVRLAGGTEDMIRDLLEMFRITSLPESPAWVELDAVVARALEVLGQQLVAKRVQVTVGPLPRVWGQPRKLAHAMTNLLGNAVKYVAAGRGRIEVSAARENGAVVVSVSDNGIGIAASYQRGIFELFGRVPPSEQVVDGEAVAGTGVGLAIVKRIVEAHHGAVAVDSAPGVGSRFSLRLPAHEEAA